ncbi:retrotransposon protein [Tanacetum coccineum]
MTILLVAQNIKMQTLVKIRDNAFNGIDGENVFEHINSFLEVVEPLKEEGKTLEDIQFCAPYQPRGQYKAAGLGFYQQNNGNSSYPARRDTMEESLPKFMTESAKRHEEKSNIIKEIRASTDSAIRNQGASIKTLDLQIVQMSKVLQERGFGSLPSSTETNPKDQVKSISTATANLSKIRNMETSPYAVSVPQHRCIFPKTVPFLRRLHNYCCDDLKEVHEVKILDAIDHNPPQKEKDTGSFNLPCFINNVCFDKAFVDLGASVSVMPFSTYINLDLGVLSYTRLTIELADRTVKQTRGIAENVLVRIGKFIFPIDIIILDIPEDDDIPLILGRPFLSTAHVKIDVFKRKVTLRVGEEKPVFKIEYGVSTSIGYGVSSSLSNTAYSSQQINTAYLLPLDTAYRSFGTETEIYDFRANFLYLSSEQILLIVYPLFQTLSIDELRSPDFNLLSEQEYSEEEDTEAMAETIEKYMSKTRTDYGLGVSRPKIYNKDQFELKGQFFKELRENTFSGSDNEDANEHIQKVLEIVDLFHVLNITEVILFYNGLDVPTRQILDSRGAVPTKTVKDAKKAIQEME